MEDDDKMERQEQWCSDCIIPASKDCHEKKHLILSYIDFLNMHYLKLKSIIKETSETCDGALEGCLKIDSANQRILTWIKWLESQSPIAEITTFNTSMISQLGNIKKNSVLPAISQEELSINSISNLIVKSSERLEVAKAIKSNVLELTHTYIHTYDSTQQKGRSEGLSNDETPNLDNWFSTALSQANQSCIDVLACLISLLRTEKTYHGNMTSFSGNCEVDQLKSSISQISDSDGSRQMLQVPKKRVQKDSVTVSSICKKVRIKLDKEIPSTLAPNIGNKEDENMPPLATAVLIGAQDSSPNEFVNKETEDVIEAVGREKSNPQEMCSVSQQTSALTSSKFYQKLAILLREETCKRKFIEEVPEQPMNIPAAQETTILGQETVHKSEEISNRITHLRGALASTVEQSKLAEELVVKARQEELNQVKLAKEAQEAVKRKTAHLNSVREKSEQFRSQLAAALQEQAQLVMADEIIDLLEKELEQIQTKFQLMEKTQTESDSRLKELQLVNAQLISTQQKLIEEAQLANKRAEKVESEIIVTIAKYDEATAKVTDQAIQLHSALEYQRMNELLRLDKERKKLDLMEERLKNNWNKPRNPRRWRNRKNWTFN